MTRRLNQQMIHTFTPNFAMISMVHAMCLIEWLKSGFTLRDEGRDRLLKRRLPILPLPSLQKLG
jgi:hypothetical protein